MQRKHQEEKELQGTFEPSKEEFSPVLYEDFEKVPNVPSNWPIEAQAIWRDVGTLLKNAGWMTKAVVLPMRALCWAAYRRQLAEEKLLLFPDSLLWEKIMDSNTKTMERLCAKFGLTPADLYRVPKMKKDEGTVMSLLK